MRIQDASNTLHCALAFARVDHSRWAIGIVCGKKTGPGGRMEDVGIASLYVDDPAINTIRKAILYGAQTILDDIVRDESVVFISAGHPVMRCPQLHCKVSRLYNARNVTARLFYRAHIEKYIWHADALVADALRRRTSITERLDDAKFAFIAV